MSIATLSEVATWDEEGVIDGLQFDSRARAIQQWREKKEAEEFDALVQKLHQRNWYLKHRDDPAIRERRRQAEIRHRRSGRKAARERERRREKYEADPIVNICEQCGSSEVVPFEKRGARRRRFCSQRCRNRHYGQQRKRSKGLRKMNIKPLALAYLRSVESATGEEVARHIDAGVKSMRTALCKWAKEGEIESDGGKPARYSLRANNHEADDRLA